MPPSLPYGRDIDFVVVEKDGKVVACVSVVGITHLEGLWIDPEHRGNAGVVRALLRQASTLPRVRGEQWVMGGAANGDDRMRGFMERLGGVPMPVEFYALWVGEEKCRQQ